MKCSYVFKKGKNSGNNCPTKVVFGTPFCRKHNGRDYDNHDSVRGLGVTREDKSSEIPPKEEVKVAPAMKDMIKKGRKNKNEETDPEEEVSEEVVSEPPKVPENNPKGISVEVKKDLEGEDEIVFTEDDLKELDEGTESEETEGTENEEEKSEEQSEEDDIPPQPPKLVRSKGQDKEPPTPKGSKDPKPKTRSVTAPLTVPKSMKDSLKEALNKSKSQGALPSPNESKSHNENMINLVKSRMRASFQSTHK